jgi:hypothetical protein
MPTFAWILFGIIGLGVLYGLVYALRALNCWLFRINEIVSLLTEIRNAVSPESQAAAPPRAEPPPPAARM